jgi:acetate kinase
MGAALDGIDVLAFTAGIGEHSAVVRAAISARLAFLGIELDHDLNERSRPDTDIARPKSGVRVLIIAAREEIVAARAARALLSPTT